MYNCIIFLYIKIFMHLFMLFIQFLYFESIIVIIKKYNFITHFYLYILNKLFDN
jgi:hypothetical protein